MKRNLILLLVLAVLGAVAVYLYNTNTQTTLRGDYKDFVIEDTASVTKIFLADKNGRTALLEKEESGKWLLNEKFRARNEGVDRILQTMHDIKVRAPVPKAEFETVVKRLASRAVKVEIYQGGDTPSKVFFVGGPNQEHSGTYMLMENSTIPYLMYLEAFYGFLTPRFFTSESEWRSSEVFAYEYGDIQEVEVKYPGKPELDLVITDLGDHNNFSLANPTTDEELSEYDPVLVRQYLTRYKKIHFESFEETKSNAFRDSVAASTPVTTYRVTDFGGNVKEIKTYLKPLPPGANIDGEELTHDVDRMYGIIDNEDFVVIQYFVFDPLLKTNQDFTLK